jgi:hypothetical protein
MLERLCLEPVSFVDDQQFGEGPNGRAAGSGVTNGRCARCRLLRQVAAVTWREAGDPAS